MNVFIISVQLTEIVLVIIMRCGSNLLIIEWLIGLTNMIICYTGCHWIRHVHHIHRIHIEMRIIHSILLLIPWIDMIIRSISDSHLISIIPLCILLIHISSRDSLIYSRVYEHTLILEWNVLTKGIIQLVILWSILIQWLISIGWVILVHLEWI